MTRSAVRNASRASCSRQAIDLNALWHRTLIEPCGNQALLDLVAEAILAWHGRFAYRPDTMEPGKMA